MSPSIKGCQPLVGFEEIKGKIILLERGECMFIDKVKTHFLVNRLTIQNEIFKVLKIYFNLMITHVLGEAHRSRRGHSWNNYG